MTGDDRDSLREFVREAVRKALAEKLEDSPKEYFAPWTGVAYESHPSRNQFNIGEATVKAGELLEFIESQACTIEKNKPCDHCGMCKTLGF